MKYLIILFCLTTNSLNGQIFMRGVEPLNPNNLWKYQDIWSFIMPTYFQVTDSLVNFGDNTFYVVETFNQNFINKEILFLGLSSNDFYIRYDINVSDSNYKYYKKNLKIGDSWSQRHFTDTYYYTVIDTFTINAWGQRFFSKQLKIRRIIETADKVIKSLWADERAAYVTPVSFNKGSLKIEATSAAAMQQFRIEQARFINEINRNLGERCVMKIDVRSKGF